MQTSTKFIKIRAAGIQDIDLVLAFIKALAKYEKLEHQVGATRELLTKNLFADGHKAY
jgi:hypothetical protein